MSKKKRDFTAKNEVVPTIEEPLESKVESEEEAPLTIEIDTNKKDYFRCSMYYMRRFFGVREITVLLILLAVGLTLFFLMANLLILILLGVCILLILVALVLFLITSSGGYKVDMEKKGITKQKLEFTEEALIVTNIGAKGNPIFKELHYYDKIEKVSIKPKRIYIYAQVSVFYYILAEHFDDQTREELVSFLKSHLAPEAFKMYKRTRALPKKKKLTLDDYDE